MNRILVAESLAAEGLAILRAGAEVDDRGDLSRDALIAAVLGCQGLIVRSGTRVDRELIEAGAESAGDWPRGCGRGQH